MKTGNYKFWTEEEHEYLRKHWPMEGSRVVAEAIGRPLMNVQRKAIRMGLKCDPLTRYSRHSETMLNGPHSCDIGYFMRDWSANLAYIVGYIYADGHLHKDLYSVNFLCHSKDEEILIAIHKELKCKTMIRRKKAMETGGRKNGPQTSFSVAGKKLVLSLVKRFGLQPRKTYLDLPMPKISDDYFGHFLRGYFDGDGHIGERKSDNGGTFSFVGTRKFVEQMSRTMNKLMDVRKTKVQKHGSIFAAEWGYHKDLKAIHKLMYPSGDYIFLRRKREVFDKVVKKTVMEKVRSNWD